MSHYLTRFPLAAKQASQKRYIRQTVRYFIYGYLDIVLAPDKVIVGVLQAKVVRAEVRDALVAEVAELEVVTAAQLVVDLEDEIQSSAVYTAWPLARESNFSQLTGQTFFRELGNHCCRHF